MTIPIKVKTLPGGRMPIRATKGASGWDLFANLSSAKVVLERGERVIIPCGVAFEIPQGYEGQVRGRSGLAARGISCHVGTIDSDYRGEICAIIRNRSGKRIYFNPGDRVAQIVFARVPEVALVPVDALEDSARGEGGFGSSGMREVIRAAEAGDGYAAERFNEQLSKCPIVFSDEALPPSNPEVSLCSAHQAREKGCRLCFPYATQPDLPGLAAFQGESLGDPDE